MTRVRRIRTVTGLVEITETQVIVNGTVTAELPFDVSYSDHELQNGNCDVDDNLAVGRRVIIFQPGVSNPVIQSSEIESFEDVDE